MRMGQIVLWMVALLLVMTNALAQQTPEIPETVTQFWNQIAKAKTVTFTALNEPNAPLAGNTKYPWIFGSHPMEGYKPSSDARFPAAMFVVYVHEDPAEPKEQEKIYFDARTGQLARCSEFRKDEKGVW